MKTGEASSWTEYAHVRHPEVADKDVHVQINLRATWSVVFLAGVSFFHGTNEQMHIMMDAE